MSLHVRKTFCRDAETAFAAARDEAELRSALEWAELVCPADEHPIPLLLAHAQIFPAAVFAPLFEAGAYLRSIEGNRAANATSLADVASALAERATRPSRPVLAAAVALSRMAQQGFLMNDSPAIEHLIRAETHHTRGHEEHACRLVEALAQVRDLSHERLLRVAPLIRADLTLALHVAAHHSADVDVWRIVARAVPHERLAERLGAEHRARKDPVLRRYLRAASSSSAIVSEALLRDKDPADFERMLRQLMRHAPERAASVLESLTAPIPAVSEHLRLDLLRSDSGSLRTAALTRLRELCAPLERSARVG